MSLPTSDPGTFTFTPIARFAEFLAEQAESMRGIVVGIDVTGLPAAAALDFESFVRAHDDWTESGAHDGDGARAVEQRFDQVLVACAALVANGYLERDPTEGADLLNAEERAQFRRLATGAAAIPAILGAAPATSPISSSPSVTSGGRRGSAGDAAPPATDPPISGEPFASPRRPLAELLRAGRSLQIDPTKLAPYADNELLLQRANPADEARVREDIVLHGIERPLLVTGEGCKSPPFTILGGHLRAVVAREAGFTDIPVLVVDHLDEATELALLARDNLRDEKRRELTPSARHRLEQLEAQRLTPRAIPGDAGVDVNTTSATVGRKWRRTRERVAEATGASANGVSNRAKVFESPASTEILKQAVNDGILSPSTAAALVRAAEKGLGGVSKLRALVVREASGVPTPRPLQAARAKIDEEVARVRTGASLSVRDATRGDSEGPRYEDWVDVRVPLKRGAGGRGGEATLGGQAYRFVVTRSEILVGATPDRAAEDIDDPNDSDNPSVPGEK